MSNYNMEKFLENRKFEKERQSFLLKLKIFAIIIISIVCFLFIYKLTHAYEYVLLDSYSTSSTSFDYTANTGDLLRISAKGDKPYNIANSTYTWNLKVNSLTLDSTCNCDTASGNAGRAFVTFLHASHFATTTNNLISIDGFANGGHILIIVDRYGTSTSGGGGGNGTTTVFVADNINYTLQIFFGFIIFISMVIIFKNINKK